MNDKFKKGDRVISSEFNGVGEILAVSEKLACVRYGGKFFWYTMTVDQCFLGKIKEPEHDCKYCKL